MRFPISKKFQKIIFFGLVFGLLFFGLSFIYNKNKGALGAEENPAEKPMVCQDEIKISLPVGIEWKISENKLEIPIGEAVDKTEYVANEIIVELQNIIDASQKQDGPARKMVSLVNHCNAEKCVRDECIAEKCATDCKKDTYDCNPYPCKCIEFDPHPCCIDDPALPCGDVCYQKKCETCWETCYVCKSLPCSGNYTVACPFREITEQYDEIKRLDGKIKDAYQKIDDIFKKGVVFMPKEKWRLIFIPPPFNILATAYLFGLDQFCKVEGIPVVNIPIPKEVISVLCKSEITQIGAALDKSRNKLAGCVTRPQDIEAVLRGEKTGKFLLSCREAVSSGILEENMCYGFHETFHPQQADNYLCCE